MHASIAGETPSVMGILHKLFRKKPAIELDDPVFGRITFKQGIWTSLPTPPDAGLMITIDAPETGPVPEQRAFFEHIHSRLGEFVQCAKDYIRPRVDAGVDVSDLFIYSLEIGAADVTGREKFVLELSDSNAIVIHRVTFRANEPIAYGFDD